MKYKSLSIVLIFLLIIAALISLIYAKVNGKKENKPEISIKEEKNPYSDNNFGFIYYPSKDSIINSQNPTIIAKLYQRDELFIDYEFMTKKSAIDNEDHKFLIFKPGRIKSLKATVDNNQTGTLYGFAQYPELICEEGYGSEKVVFRSAQECIRQKRQYLPPVIVFLKTNKTLKQGFHNIKLKSSGGKEIESGFEYDSLHNTQDIKLDWPDDSMERSVNVFSYNQCASGYYYDKGEYIHIPLPENEKTDLYYKLVFPSGKDSELTGRTQHVNIKFEKDIYDLVFPNRQIFYTSFDPEGEEHYLFLPTDILYFTNGTQANYWKSEPGSYYYEEYYGLIPIDLSGKTYHQYFLPWSTSSFSGCDG